jgi:hypothetical protein
VHFLDEKHCIVFVCGHQKVVVSEAHQAVEFELGVGLAVGVGLAGNELSPEEAAVGVFEVCVVE